MSKYEFKKLFAVNKHGTHLVLKGGFLDIPKGGYAPISEADLLHPDLDWARTRGWVEITEKEPDASTLAKPELPYAEMRGYQGLTEDELKASQADAAPETPKATTEALGQVAGVETTSEATSERIGESAEAVNKRGRKATTKE